MRCFHLQFFFALVPSGEFRASGREFLCPRRQRNQNAAEPTVRTPFSRLLRQLTLSGEAPEPLRAPLARLAECYSPPAGPPCRTPCRTAQGMRHAYRTRRAVSPAPCRWPGSLSKESCFSEANPTMKTEGPGSGSSDLSGIGPGKKLGKPRLPGRSEK